MSRQYNWLNIKTIACSFACGTSSDGQNSFVLIRVWFRLFPLRHIWQYFYPEEELTDSLLYLESLLLLQKLLILGEVLLFILYITFINIILQQESAITNMENRNYFSLHCIQMETQLIHSNMIMLSSALREMASVESSGYSEVGYRLSHLYLCTCIFII